MASHLLTGAGSGIGQVLADRLHARGDDLVLVARTAERADDLSGRYAGAQVLVADLADAMAVDALELPASLDSVVHAAGVVDLGRVEELTTAQWRLQVDVNLLAPVGLTRLALPALRSARGTVLFVNSGAGLRAHPEWSAYAASKFGLRAFADVLRAEESGSGVRVTSVFPGRTATPMQRKVHEQEGAAYDAADWIDPATVADAMLHVLDLPRDATVPDLTISPGPRAD